MLRFTIGAVGCGGSAVAVVWKAEERLIAMIRAQVAAGEMQQALSTYEKLATRMPNSPVPLIAQADLQMAAKDLSAAENSLRKAYTSLTAKVPSGEYGKRVTANPTSAGLLNLENITTVEGALPIFAGSDLVGSIGISGAPGGDKDAACAQAGIDRIARGLAAN